MQRVDLPAQERMVQIRVYWRPLAVTHLNSYLKKTLERLWKIRLIVAADVRRLRL